MDEPQKFLNLKQSFRKSIRLLYFKHLKSSTSLYHFTQPQHDEASEWVFTVLTHRIKTCSSHGPYDGYVSWTRFYTCRVLNWSIKFDPLQVWIIISDFFIWIFHEINEVFCSFLFCLWLVWQDIFGDSTSSLTNCIMGHQRWEMILNYVCFFPEGCTLKMKMHHSCSDESAINQLSRSYSEHSDSSQQSVSHLHSRSCIMSSSLWSPRFKQSVHVLTYFRDRAL